MKFVIDIKSDGPKLSIDCCPEGSPENILELKASLMIHTAIDEAVSVFTDYATYLGASSAVLTGKAAADSIKSRS